YVRAYKQSKRHYGARAIVNAGLSVLLDHNSHVQEVFFAFGGMSGAVVRAPNAENFIAGKKWGDENVLKQLIQVLYEEFQLSFSVTGGMATYRKTLIVGFITKFWYDVTKSANIAELSPDIENSIGEIKRGVSKGSQTIGRPEKGNKIVGKPISHASAMKQATGEAIYVDDIPRIEAIEQNSYFPTTPQLAREDVEKGFEEADYIFEGEARSGAQEHFYLETNASLVIPKEDDEFEVHSGCQNPTSPQERIADVLGIAANKVTSRVKRVGGAFGGKETKSLYVSTALAVSAWQLRKPVRCMLDRDEDIIMTGQRHPFLGRWKVGLTKDRKILAYDLKLYLNGGGTTDYTIVVAQVSLLATDGCYYIPNVRFIGYPCKTNIISTTVFRGFGQLKQYSFLK
ncbi:Molybdopterin-binding domain of aldehyde dehydrogenase-domain-containing protein, partial [Gigaspora rosea]